MRLKVIVFLTLLLVLFFAGCGNETSSSETGSIKIWTNPVKLTVAPLNEPGPLVTFPQKVAMNNNGQSTITWYQNDSSNWQIYKSEYLNGTWAHPTDLHNDSISTTGHDALFPEVAMDDNGNAIIVWHQNDGTSFRIYMGEYRNGKWTYPANLAADAISPPGGNAFNPHVAMDNNGNAIIVWMQSNGRENQIYMSEYRNGRWTHPADLLTDAISLAGQEASTPRVAMDDNGNAIIVWTQDDYRTTLPIRRIYKSEYRNGRWTHPSDFIADAINPPGGGIDVSWAQVEMDNSRNAIIVWSQYDWTNWRIYKTEYHDGIWYQPSDLSNDAISLAGYDASYPNLAMNNNGSAIISWEQSDGTNFRIYRSEYRNGRWEQPTDLINDAMSIAGQNASNPQVALESNGDAIITWWQSDGYNFKIYKSEFRNGTWEHPSDLVADAIGDAGQDAYFPDVAMDNSGNAIITWEQSEGINSSIYMIEYR